ncbi:MAG: ABC transporter permease [Ignavibacteria bacterium RIFOXYB2_FULL_35_12]|nr:MAG: ABC transporter permease [Ignavibacteria bacterium GWA2_36_19]OGU51275.1 MAG: ABC transporter permease [Ignavibacteria bacterium GWC2_35_8]OGU55790.1 MAG: ABC transporter permease [Ignavibacteria bacterium GWF2_35_20]OGU83037.1 MAG: ABC transporter permease [Ignavibacteria bacterium RIFOXYA2_FULL_35_9]OGU87074.1 MAG: ABC transporter permease [Ignavibacteria bacterium RIFOXYC12_FULL_35_11]OGU87166.1 MAG: ABC transporter permease [Ignavibacteria bacterium RIFOXYA12_FULL_35_25]OGU93505.1
MIWKIFLFLLLGFVSVAGIAFPIVQSPTKWYEFPFIIGLEQNAKIIFFHVPTAWLTVIAFLMSTVFSVQYLRKKNLDYDAKSYAAAQLGMIFCILATVTGSVWSKFAWGSFWSWDPRQTSIFALLLIYGAWFALRSAIESEDKRATLSSVYSIIAFLTVPFFIFIMPRIMTGLHPGSADDTNAGPIVDFKMNPSMQLIFFLSMIGFTILYFWMWNLGYKSIILNEKINKQLTRG